MNPHQERLKGMKFSDSTNEMVLSEGNENEMIIKDQQYIPDSFLDELKSQRNYNDSRPFGNEMVKLASIPVAIVDQWYREGFDVQRESASAIMDRLRRYELTKFLTTSKRV